MKIRYPVIGVAGLVAMMAMTVALAQPDDLQPGVQTSPTPAAPEATAPSGAAVGVAAPADRTEAPSARGTPVAPGLASPADAPRAGSPNNAIKPQAKAGASGANPSASPSAGPTTGSSADRIQLGTTQISGNAELPKLLYIVPWRRAEIGQFAGRPPNSLVDEVLTPVDRAVFERQNRYYAALQSGIESARSQSSVGADATTPTPPKDEK